MVSVIVPICNEEKILTMNYPKFKALSKSAELIFVDCGSSDRSVEIVSGCGNVLSCEKGRAIQMNYGARYAQSSTLLFLHADSVVMPGALLSIEEKIEGAGYIGGCLTQRIQRGGLVYRIIECQGNLRARFSKVFYGDQGIFVRKDLFFNLGGFPEAPIMEDVLFTRKLRLRGKTVVLPDKIFVSPRRWVKAGIMKTALIYSLISLLFRIGHPLKKIKLLYDDLR